MAGSGITASENFSVSPAERCVFPYDGPWALSITGTQCILWHTDEEREISRFQAHEQDITACVFSLDGTKFVTASKDKSLKIWKTETVQQFLTLTGHSDILTCCAFSNDGTRIASGSSDGTIKLWDSNTGKLLHTLTHGNPVQACTFSPEKNLLAVFYGDSCLNVWNPVNGEKIRSFAKEYGNVVSCCFSFGGEKLLTGSLDGVARIWDSQSGVLNRTLAGHRGPVLSCAFSVDGKNVATGSGDTTLKVWGVNSDAELRTLKGHSGSVTSCAFYPHGRSICSGSTDGTIRVWDIPTGDTKLIRHGPASQRIPSFPNGDLDIRQSPALQLKLYAKEIISLVRRGEFEEALQVAQKASEYARKHFGPDSLEYAGTLIDVGLLDVRQGKYFFLAEKSLKQALEIKRKIFSGKHPEIGELQFYLGSLYLKMDRLADARTSIQEAIGIRKVIKDGWNNEIAEELDTLIESLQEYANQKPIEQNLYTVQEDQPGIFKRFFKRIKSEKEEYASAPMTGENFGRFR